MPHQCTDCGREFDDGSTEMLSGCPDCGGTTFQYRPDGEQAAESAEEPPEPPDPPVDNTVARTVGNAATAVRDFVGTTPSPPDRDQRPDPDGPTSEIATESGPETGDVSPGDTGEDSAQASARSEVVSRDDLPPAPDSPATASTPDRSTPGGTDTTPSGRDTEEPRHDRPDLEELRAELNDQFESIRVLEPGQYELNLMELYDREEYIIALQEDGKYTIQVPDRWKEE